MSSYIVDDSTINRILAAVQLYTHSNLAEVPPPPRDIQSPEPRFKDWCFLDWALLGARLRDMNVAAVIARYGQSDELPGPTPLLPYQHENTSAPSPIQVIKSLGCYLYQCSEGNIPSRPLYQSLSSWETALCRHYVSQSDEWQQAEWG